MFKNRNVRETLRSLEVTLGFSVTLLDVTHLVIGLISTAGLLLRRVTILLLISSLSHLWGYLFLCLQRCEPEQREKNLQQRRAECLRESQQLHMCYAELEDIFALDFYFYFFISI